MRPLGLRPLDMWLLDALLFDMLLFDIRPFDMKPLDVRVLGMRLFLDLAGSSGSSMVACGDGVVAADGAREWAPPLPVEHGREYQS